MIGIPRPYLQTTESLDEITISRWAYHVLIQKNKSQIDVQSDEA